MKKLAGFAALAIAVILCAHTSANAWSPPIGIPAPPFGINETAGPFTHYVDNTSPAATDTSNPNGSPSKPRQTIPSVLSAGSVVEVHGGPYIYNISGPPAVTANGTATKPIFIRGVGAPIIQGGGTAAQGLSDRTFLMVGSYYIVEDFKFCNGTTMNVALTGDHGVLRKSEVVNLQPPAYSAGVTAVGAYHVIYSNHIHHNGNYLSAIDNKVHGIKLATQSDHVWILNNEIDHNGGQAMQIGDDNIADDTIWPHHIYIGFNDMHEDMEMAVAMKQARDVVISQNYIHDYLPYANGIMSSDSKIGHTAMPVMIDLARFGTHRVWALFNVLQRGLTGIRANGTIPDPPHPQESDAYVIGNVITDIHSATYNATDPYSAGAAIIGWQTIRVYVVDNTIANSDKGISFTSVGYYEVTGNLIKNTGAPMSLVPTNWGLNRYDYNFYDPSAVLAWGDPASTISLSQMQRNGQDTHSLQGSALLDATMKPTSGSPASGANKRSPVYDVFFSLYGIDISKDAAGKSRPTGAAWTVGAYEFGSGTAAPPPAPTGLTVR